MRLGAKIGVAWMSAHTPSLLLDKYSGAAAAYSLRKLSTEYSGNAVQVRRDTDNQTQDIGFVNNLFDSATLETFVNQDYVRIQSDYSGESPSPNAATSGLTLTSNQSIEGVDSALKVTSTINGTPYFYISNIGGSGVELKISFDYYILNEQGLDTIRCGVASGREQDFTVRGQWASAEFEQTSTQTFIIFRGVNAEIDNVFYIKNLVITQTSSNAYVTTWYDQSGNGNDVVNATASSQPKIVSAGSTILESGKPSIDFASNKFLFESSVSLTQPFTRFSVRRYTDEVTSQDVFLQQNSGSYSNILDLGYNTYKSHFGSYFAGDAETFTNNISYLLANGVNSETKENNSTLYTGNTGTNGLSGLRIGLSPLTSFFRSNVKGQEVIIWDNDQSTNRIGIETDINTHYSIY